MKKQPWKSGTCCALLFAMWQMIPALAEESYQDLDLNESEALDIFSPEVEPEVKETTVAKAADVAEDAVAEEVVADDATTEPVAKAEEVPALNLDEAEGEALAIPGAKQEEVVAEVGTPVLNLSGDEGEALDIPNLEDSPMNADSIQDDVLKNNQLMKAKSKVAEGKKARERMSFADAEVAYNDALAILDREFPGEDQVKDVATLKRQLEAERLLNLEQWAERLSAEAAHERNANKIKEAIDKLRGLMTYYKTDFESDKVLVIEGRIRDLERQADAIDLGNILGNTRNDADIEGRQIDKLYEEARYNYTLGKYDVAREKANKILLANPYEKRALELIGKISLKQREVGFLASETRRMDMVTQTIWNWVNTLPPALEDLHSDEDSEIVDIGDDTIDIRTNLREWRVEKENEIKANNSIKDICILLEGLAKELDEQGNGIKFVAVDYKKSKNASAATAPVAEVAAEDDWGDDWGDEEPVEATAAAPAEEIPFEDMEIFTALPLKGLSLEFILEQIVKFYGGRIAYEINSHTVVFYDPKFKPIELEERSWLVATNLFGDLESDDEGYGDYDDEEDMDVSGGGSSSSSGEFVYTDKIGKFFESQGVYFSKDGRYFTNLVDSNSGEDGEEGGGSTETLWEDDYRPGYRAHVSYNKNTGVLRMVNTREMLQRADELVNTRVIRDLVQVEAKFVEVEQTNDEILSFKWQIANGLINYDPAGHSTGGNPLSGSRYNGLDADGNHTYTGDNTTGTLANNGKSQSIGLGDQMSNITSGLRDYLVDQDGQTLTANPLLDVWGVFGGTAINMVMSAVSQSNEKNILFAPHVTTRSGVWARLSTQTLRHFIEVSYDGSTSQSTDNNGNARDTSGGLQLETWSFLEGVDLWILPSVQSDRYTVDLDMIPDVTLLDGWQTLRTRNSDGEPFTVPNDDGGDSTIDIEIVRPILTVRRVTGGKGRGFKTGGGLVAAPAGDNDDREAKMKILDPLGSEQGKSQNINYADSQGVSLAVWDGESVVLGGLINERIEKFHDKVPFLGDIPFVGRLFQSKGETSKKFNLMIFVTARIVNPAGVPIRQHKARGMPDFSR